MVKNLDDFPSGTRKQVQDVIANAMASTTASPPESGKKDEKGGGDKAVPTKKDPHQKARRKPPTGGGGGNKGGGGHSSPAPSKPPLSSVPGFRILAALLIGFIVYYFIGELRVYQRGKMIAFEEEEVQLELKKTKVLAEKKKLEQPQVITPPSVTMTTSTCRNQDEMDKVLASGQPQVINRSGVAYKFMPGCAIIRAEVGIEKLAGSAYRLSTLTKNSSGYFVCGSDNELSHSSSECINFLNTRRGENLLLIIQNSGNFSVN